MTQQLKCLKVVDPPKPKPMMRARACQHCPSAHYPADPEARTIRSAPKDLRLEHAFICAWDNDFYCRGYCISMGITNDDLLARDGDQ